MGLPMQEVWVDLCENNVEGTGGPVRRTMLLLIIRCDQSQENR